MSDTVPCEYRMGKTLGSGTYAIVREAVHVHTGQYYACKVINKKLMEGREDMVRNEITVLKRVSSGHQNIVNLHDYFETAYNLYFVFELCTGGELFDRICARGSYYEADAANLVRTILGAVKHIHDAGIVHRDLKPENLLFRTLGEEADIMIADFGLSRIIEEEKHDKIMEICGTNGYIAPEVLNRAGHGKPVDIWSMGVTTYFILAGYTPFDRETQQLETEAVITGNYKFEPAEYWSNVSKSAKYFIRACLTLDPTERPTAQDLLEHKWLASGTPHFVQEGDGNPIDLLPHIKRATNAERLWKKAVNSIRAMNRMSALLSAHQQAALEVTQLQRDLEQYKNESEKEDMEKASIMHQHTFSARPVTSLVSC